VHEFYGATNGWTGIGAPTYSIHGRSTRHLPQLNLNGISPIEVGQKLSEAKFHITLDLLAQGYRRSVMIPVFFTIDGQPSWTEPDLPNVPEWI
jgi:hypothetical protein